MLTDCLKTMLTTTTAQSFDFESCNAPTEWKSRNSCQALLRMPKTDLSTCVLIE